VPLDEGNGGGTGGTSLRLDPGARGRWTAARGAVASRGAAARSFEGGRRPRVGQAGPNGLMTRAGKENSRKKKKINGLPGNFGPDWKQASCGGNKEKRKWAAQEMWAKIVMGRGKIPFQILNQGFEIK
jgi:hypothetical protein